MTWKFQESHYKHMAKVFYGFDTLSPVKEFEIIAKVIEESISPKDVLYLGGSTLHQLIVEWENKYYSNSSIVGQRVIILPSPPGGYEYILQESSRKKCAKCGKKSEFYSIAPYMSKYDGEPICYECIDK